MMSHAKTGITLCQKSARLERYVGRDITVIIPVVSSFIRLVDFKESLPNALSERSRKTSYRNRFRRNKWRAITIRDIYSQIQLWRGDITFELIQLVHREAAYRKKSFTGMCDGISNEICIDSVANIYSQKRLPNKDMW